MKKIIKFSLTLLFISIVILGCQSQNNEDNSNKLELDGKIKKVNIYKSNDFDKENSDLILSFSDEETLITLKNIINSATRQEGIVSTTEPDYDLEIIYEDDNKEQIYLWLIESGKGSLMKVENTHIIYNLSEEMNDKFIALIESYENINTEALENPVDESSEDDTKVTGDKIGIAKVDNVTLYANRETDGVYEEITVQTNAESKTFPWVSTSNPTYAPTIQTADVDGDTVEEIIVLLTTDHGTGVLKQKIHVLNLEDLTEINVEDPVKAINEKVTSTITKNNGKVNAVIKWDGNIHENDFNESDAGFWFDDVAFGAHVYYEIVGSKINAVVSGAVSPARFPVAAIVGYDSDLIIESIVVKEGYVSEMDD